jgi:hypothetical protein
MGQSRTESLIEAAFNQCVGIAYAILIYTILGWTWQKGLSVTLIFSCLGLLRVFGIRRLFVWWKRNKEDG